MFNVFTEATNLFIQLGTPGEADYAEWKYDQAHSIIAVKYDGSLLIVQHNDGTLDFCNSGGLLFREQFDNMSSFAYSNGFIAVQQKTMISVYKITCFHEPTLLRTIYFDVESQVCLDRCLAWYLDSYCCSAVFPSTTQICRANDCTLMLKTHSVVELTMANHDMEKRILEWLFRNDFNDYVCLLAHN